MLFGHYSAYFFSGLLFIYSLIASVLPKPSQNLLNVFFNAADNEEYYYNFPNLFMQLYLCIFSRNHGEG